MDAIGNAKPMEIDPGLDAATLKRNQDSLIAATTEVFDIVASLDSRMTESFKGVLRDVITAAGDEGKTAFNSTFFLRFLVPFLSVRSEDNSPNNESNKIIADVLQKTANEWSRVQTTVNLSDHAEQEFLDPLALPRISKIDALFKKIALFATAARTNSSDDVLGDLQDSRPSTPVRESKKEGWAVSPFDELCFPLDKQEIFDPGPKTVRFTPVKY
jgi:hypothetical protein